MYASRIGRRAVLALVGAALAGVAPLGRLALASTTKENVLKGCRDAGNSAIDNPDGSYQCNLKDGGEIRCDTKDQCIYRPPAKPGQINHVPGRMVDVGGLVDLVQDGAFGSGSLAPVGSVLEAPELGVTLVVGEPLKTRQHHGRRRRR